MSYKTKLKNIGDLSRDDFANEAIKILGSIDTDKDVLLDNILTLAVRAMDSEYSEDERNEDFAKLKRKIAEL